MGAKCRTGAKPPKRQTHLYHSHRTAIASRRTPKNKTISLDMHVRKTIRHHEDRRSISTLFASLAFGGSHFVLGSVFGPTAWSQITRIVPKLYLPKESFCVGSFVCPRISFLIPVLFGNDGVSSRRQHKEIGDHCRGLWVNGTWH